MAMFNLFKNHERLSSPMEVLAADAQNKTLETAVSYTMAKLEQQWPQGLVDDATQTETVKFTPESQPMRKLTTTAVETAVESNTRQQSAKELELARIRERVELEAERRQYDSPA